jgi:phenylpropionate dioxygenase-like ring-hydroxylating dioxygenase large terminal subunit
MATTIPDRYTLEYPEIGTGPLPVHPYVSAEFYEKEREKIFRRVWLNVGRVEEIPSPGNYMVRDIEVVDASIILIRGKDGQIRGFHNVCIHRGNKLIWDDCGSCGAIKCKYHGWTYSTSGQLIGVPEEDMFFDFEKEKIKLVPVTTDVWEGFIFINVAAKPELSLQEYLGELVPQLKGFPFDKLTACYSYKADLQCNWKIVVDSQQEGYHAKTLHHRSLPGFLRNEKDPSRHVVHVKLYPRSGVISYYGNRERPHTRVEEMAFKLGAAAVTNFAKEFSPEHMALGLNPTRDPNWAFDEYVIFPNFQILLFMGMYITHQVWPLSIDRCIWEARLYLLQPTDTGSWFTNEYTKCMLRDAWLEDGSTLEASQVGIASGVINHFILQDQELMIRHFHRLLNEYIG